MTYRTPGFRPDHAVEITFAQIQVGDTLVLPTPWWAPAPGYETGPVTRIQQMLVELREGHLVAARGVITDTRVFQAGAGDLREARTSAQLAAAEHAIVAGGGEAAVGVRVWYRTGSGYETFVLVPPARIAVVGRSCPTALPADGTPAGSADVVAAA